MIETRLIVDANNHLGEGPLWDVKEQRLYWIDSTAAEISSCRADGSDIRRYFVPRHIGSMALRERGGAVVALANGLHFYDFEAQTVKFIADPESDDPDTRFNDGKVDRRALPPPELAPAVETVEGEGTPWAQPTPEIESLMEAVLARSVSMRRSCLARS